MPALIWIYSILTRRSMKVSSRVSGFLQMKNLASVWNLLQISRKSKIQSVLYRVENVFIEVQTIFYP